MNGCSHFDSIDSLFVRCACLNNVIVLELWDIYIGDPVESIENLFYGLIFVLYLI